MRLVRSSASLVVALAAGCLALPACTQTAPGGGHSSSSPSADADDADDGDEEAIALDAVPAAALAAARGAVAGITFTSAEKETERGVVVYSLAGTADGKAYEVEVTGDGKVLEVESGDDDHEDDGDDD